MLFSHVILSQNNDFEPKEKAPHKYFYLRGANCMPLSEYSISY